MITKKTYNVIYRILNKKNGKQYIGSAINFFKRKKRHINSLKLNNHHSKKLQNAWNKYGEENFIFEIIEENLEPEELILKEQIYIDLNQSFIDEFGYNVCSKAYSSLGFKHSEESKIKMSVEKQNNGSKYGRSGVDHWGYGRKLGKYHKEKLVKSKPDMKGVNSPLHKLNEEDVLKIRELAGSGVKQKMIAECFHVNPTCIGKIIRKERWAHI